MPGIRVCIDRGGTFTDVIAFIPNHIYPKDTVKPSELYRRIVLKLLSVDPTNYDDAPREGIRRVLELATGIPHPRSKLVDTSNLELIRMGTTVATNALLERKGERTLLLITEGFKDLLRIGNQSRPNIFDLSIERPDVLFDQVLEVPERVTLVGYSAVPSGMKVEIPANDPNYIKGVTGEWIHILKPLDVEYMEQKLKNIRTAGINSVAICLLHSFTFPLHELLLEDLCKKLGFSNISISSRTSQMVKIVSRGTSTTANAYLTPGIHAYMQSFFSGFDKGMLHATNGKDCVKVEFMQSDGGLVHFKKFNGFKAILSGPAGGVVGYATTSYDPEVKKAIIGFDMGGTSTDVSRFDGNFEHVFETTTAGITIQAPQLDISTVAAGGGSRLYFRNGMFVVGPESASADPGPVCYRKDGHLAITDANLVLGRLIPEYFPKIFGKSEKEPLDLKATGDAFKTLSGEINKFLTLQSNQKTKSVDEIAYGFIQVANESMCRPIRALTQGKGKNAADHILACFGGAGGQHAFAIASSLGIKMVLIHRYASILSAYGQALADVVVEVQEPAASSMKEENMRDIKEISKKLISTAEEELRSQGFPDNHIITELYFNLRYAGTDTSIMTLKPCSGWDFHRIFIENYQKDFGFTLPDREILLDDIRVRGIGKSIATGTDVKWTTVHKELKTLVRHRASKPDHINLVYWQELGRVDTHIYLLSSLKIGAEVAGPALIIDDTSTIAVEPYCSAVLTSEHVVGFIGSHSMIPRDGILSCDPILLSVFGHRFMSIAEQMGKTLQKTSISTNIKERLDFSCALFGPDGGLVANAPHIPVHLGSMQEAVRWQLHHGGKIKEGNVLVTNHPMAGGSHLPDITVITPVFEEGQIVFFVASRGHHADIGGIAAGSMPPNSRELYEEGAAIKSFLLVHDGIFDEDGITKLLRDVPSQFQGCVGTRSIKDNISDLKAQVAANQRGITLVSSLIKEYGLNTVQNYMIFIQENAHYAVSELLKRTANEYGAVLQAIDHMDDGSPISLTVSITGGTALFDFSGTGYQVYGNTNAPKSVTYSAIIYCLRCLINLDIPLNQGALRPIQILIPDGSMLNPDESAAVVGGNVLTSQRLCDVIFKAFKACAASQGCCNNLTFGRDSSIDGESFAYYETIAGGAGAGHNWDGRSGVHSHMTNTRITDPEILERRYPVVLREFGLRVNSGGKGEHFGGDGCVREIEFLEELQVSILSERRIFQPYGLKGGNPGQSGMNLLIRDNGAKIINFGGKNSCIVKKGDRLKILTPGGGGFGIAGKRKIEKSKIDSKDKRFVKIAGGSLQNYQEVQNSL